MLTFIKDVLSKPIASTTIAIASFSVIIYVSRWVGKTDGIYFGNRKAD